MIEKLQDFPDNVAAYVCHGHLTKADYAGVIPHIQDKLAAAQEAAGLHRTRARFRRDRFRRQVGPGGFGFGHLFDFERVAFVSDVTWMNRAVQVFALFIPGQWRAFPTAEASKAREWIVENQQ